MNEDWRLFNQENYLLKRSLRKAKFPECYDHAHCALFYAEGDWLHRYYYYSEKEFEALLQGGCE